jgi:hypothetical protein
VKALGANASVNGFYPYLRYFRLAPHDDAYTDIKLSVIEWLSLTFLSFLPYPGEKGVSSMSLSWVLIGRIVLAG